MNANNITGNLDARRDAILESLSGLPLDETLGLLAESISQVLHAENVRPRSLAFADFEITLVDAISGRLQAMADESRSETPEKIEPEYSDIQRAYRQAVRPLLALTNREAEAVVTEIIGRLLFDQGVRGSLEEIAEFKRVFGSNVRAILQHLTVEADGDSERVLADAGRVGATFH